MAELKQHALLLSFVAVLLVLKLIILPVFQWQDAMLADIRLLEKKILKINQVLSDETEHSKFNQNLTSELAKANDIFFPKLSESAFKLKHQKMLASMLDKNKLTATNVGWQVTAQFDELAMKRYQLQIHLQGQTINIVNFMSELESFPQRIRVIDFYLALQGQKLDNAGQVNGWIKLNLYADNQAESQQVGDVS